MSELLSIRQAKQQLAANQLSSHEWVQSCLQRIEKTNDLGTVFLGLRAKSALQEAQQADARRRQGQSLSALDGVPVAIKDNMSMQGEGLTCASQILKSYVAPYSSHVVQALQAAGAIIVGRTNLDEFAMGSSNENSSFGVVKNPWKHEYVPGGSSGGSAAAVAAGLVPLALGSDTGGSVRLPASFCGVVGVKPTYGRVSRYGLVAFASSLDQIGPIAATVEDSALLLQVIAGHDAKDSTSSQQAKPDYAKTLGESIRGLRIGIAKEYISHDIDTTVATNYDASIKLLQSLGAEMVEVSLPHNDYAVACYYVIACAEASANLARFDGVRYTQRAAAAGNLAELYQQSRTQGFGAEVKRRIMLGTFVLSSGYYDAYYAKAQAVRQILCQDFATAFTKCDVIVTPTSPFTAFKLGERAQNPLQMYLSDIFTTSVNLVGLPALSVPSGLSRDGLPIGLQLIGPAFTEARLLQVAHQFEQAAAWKTKVSA